MTRHRSGDLVLFAVGAILLGGILIALAAASASDPSPVWRPIALAMGAHAPYAALVVLAFRRGAPAGSGWIMVGAFLALRLLLVAAPPIFSDDVHRYVWDGRVIGAGYDPYDHAPSDPELAFLRDDGWRRMNNPSLRTIYPPAAQVVFAITARIWPSAFAFKALSAIADAGVALLAMWIAGWRPKARERGVAGRRWAVAGTIYGFSPLACIETGMSGHLEPVALIPTLLAVALLGGRARSSPGEGCDAPVPRSGSVLGSVSLGAACALKLAPLLLIPALARRARWAISIAPLVLLALYVPFLIADGWKSVETLDAFARRWEGNAGLFALIRSGATEAIGALFGVSRPDEIVHVPCLDGIARAAHGTFFSLHKDSALDPTRPASFTLGDLSLAAAKLIAAAALVAVVARSVVRRLEPARAAEWAIGALVLLTPVLHPWYILWVLPFAAIRGSWPWIALACASFLSYLPLDRWRATGEWIAPSWVPWVEWGALFSAAAVHLWIRRGRSPSARRPGARGPAVDPSAR